MVPIIALHFLTPREAITKTSIEKTGNDCLLERKKKEPSFWARSASGGNCTALWSMQQGPEKFADQGVTYFGLLYYR